MSRFLSPRQIWGMPLLLGVLSLFGLVAALVSDGWGDALSWIALATPAAVGVWGFRGRGAEGQRPAPAPGRAVGVRPKGPRG